MYKIFETPISFLKPEILINAEQAYASRKTELESLKAIQDQGISNLVEAEKAAGLDIITDGAFRNLLGLRDFWMWLQGVTPTVVTTGHVYQDQNSGEVIPRVADKISHNHNHNILNNFSFLQGKIGDGSLVRVDIPGPSQFLVELVRNGWYDTSVYPSIDDLALDIATAYHGTLHDLYTLGCRRVLLIDPSWGRLCDSYASKRLLQGGIDLVGLPKIMRKTNEKAIEGLPGDMHIILYTPFDVPLRAECADVVKYVCSHQRVNAFMVDYPDNNEGFLDFLKLIPKDKDVILGVEDSKQPQSLTQDEISEIITKVSSAIPDHNIRLTTKGGFTNSTDTINFSSIDEHDQWYKLQNLMSFMSHHLYS